MPTEHNALRVGCALFDKMAAVIRALTRAQLICYLLLNELGDPLCSISDKSYFICIRKI